MCKCVEYTELLNYDVSETGVKSIFCNSHCKVFCLIFPHISFYLLNFAEAFFPKHNSLFCSEHGPLIEFLITFRSQSRICQVMKCLTWSNTVNYICCQEGQKSCSILLHSRLLLGWKVFHNDLTATWQIFFFFLEISTHRFGKRDKVQNGKKKTKKEKGDQGWRRLA